MNSLRVTGRLGWKNAQLPMVSPAISYTTGVPAMIGAAMLLTGKWNKPGVYTVEEFDPDPYMEALNKWGLPWQINDKPVLVD